MALALIRYTLEEYKLYKMLVCV
nr:unnamed protein product [Callosobruchus analis]